MKKGYKMISFQIDPTKCNLNAKEVRILVEQGPDFFMRLKNTKDSKDYLDDNKELAEVINKW